MHLEMSKCAGDERRPAENKDKPDEKTAKTFKMILDELIDKTYPNLRG